MKWHFGTDDCKQRSKHTAPPHCNPASPSDVKLVLTRFKRSASTISKLIRKPFRMRAEPFHSWSRKLLVNRPSSIINFNVLTNKHRQTVQSWANNGYVANTFVCGSKSHGHVFCFPCHGCRMDG